MVKIDTDTLDIKESNLQQLDKHLLSILLKDHSTKNNIIWATDNYLSLGSRYASEAPITADLIIGDSGNIIQPRIAKTLKEQQIRTKEKAEVFTPSWICNKQNNLIDEAWFDAADIFNIEKDKEWIAVDRHIPFPTKDGKTWQNYVEDERLEITCGEAPYLVSRYDTITGVPIALQNRIGLLDRKMRVVKENTANDVDWIQWAMKAFQSTYGFEWQGDNLLLARENLLFSFVDYYQDRFSHTPAKELLREIAKVVSWNIWQMDGLKGVVPNSCKSIKMTMYNLFGEVEESITPCQGCKRDDMHQHNGIQCKIKDWKTGGTLKFVSLINKERK